MMPRPWWNIGALDLVNFSLADVRGAFGPYLGVFLVTQQHWNQAAVGLIATISGLVGLVIQAPWGALIDAVRCKRALIVAGLTVLALGAMAVAWWPSFAAVMTAKTLMAVAGTGFGPAVAAMTLGLCPPYALAWRLGQNAAWDHAGHVTITLVAGAVGFWLSQRAVFFLVPVCAIMAAMAVLSIPARAIDHARARGLEPSAELLMALLVGARAEHWGRKPLLLAAFAALPIRGVLFTLSNDRSWLVTVQCLDGVGNGLFGALRPLVLHDLMRGTGRYNIAAGAVATIQGIGAVLSHVVAGCIVVAAGYNIAFLTLATIACAAFTTFLVGMPETRRGDSLKAEELVL